jgi:hypothetical protein
MNATGASCPRCGADAPAPAPRCPRCGFGFLESPPPRSRRGPARRWIAVGLAASAAAAAALATGRQPAPQEASAVAAPRAEERLERQLATAEIDDAASVRCPRTIRAGRSTRCQVRYANGDTQLILVTLLASGELDVDVPYPAQRRPAH